VNTEQRSEGEQVDDSRRHSVAAAIDIGGTNTKISLVSRRGLAGEGVRTFPTPKTTGPAELLDILVHEVSGLESGGERLCGAGIAAPGFLSPDGETIEHCQNLPVLTGYPWRELLAERLGIPITLEVDANAAALGEYHFGAGKRIDRLLVLSLGTGVGCSMLVDGQPLRFTGGCCGDLGHIYVGSDKRCSEGCTGCLESVVSVQSLGGSAAGVRRLITGALSGEQDPVEAFRRAGQFLARGIASMAVMLNPHLVLLAGGIAEAGSLLTDPANQALAEYVSPYFQVRIEKGALGATAALAGVAAHFVKE
jgi:glucokinase